MLIQENQYTQNIIHPGLCNDLLNAGLDPRTIKKWKIYSDDAEDVRLIESTKKENEGGSKDVAEVIDHRPHSILPAYQLMDVVRLLPHQMEYKLIDKGYEVRLPNMWNILPKSATRLPDAFAKMLLECIKQGVIKLNTIEVLGCAG